MTRDRRFMLAILLDLGLVVGEAVGGLFAHSSGLLATSGHDLADAAALGVALAANRMARRPATSDRSFGFHRATILAALANAAAVAAVAVAVAVIAGLRIASPVAVHGGLVVVVAAAGLIGNGAAVAILHERGADLNTRAVVLHFAGDALAALGVVAAGALIALTGRFALSDPIVSVLIAVLIGIEAWRLVRESVDILLESTPADLDVAALAASLSETAGVSDVHDLHCWSLSSEVRALSAHLVLDGHPSLEQAQLIAEQAKARLGERFRVAHATLELECERCSDEVADVCAIEPAPTR